MLATKSNRIITRTAQVWSRHIGSFAALGRVASIAVGTALVIMTATSTIDATRELEARELLAAGDAFDTSGFRLINEDGTRFTGRDKDYEEFRLVLMGASETARLGSLNPEDTCGTLIACLTNRVSERVTADVTGLHLQAAGSGRNGRLGALAWLSEADLDIDLLVVTYSLHGIAAESRSRLEPIASRERPDAAIAQSKEPLLARTMRSSPLAVLDRLLSTKFFSYDTRFKYSIAQWIPVGTTPLVYRVHTTQDGDTRDHPGGVVETMNVAEAQVFAASIVRTLGTAHAQDGRLGDSMETLRDMVQQAGIPTVVVFTPIDDTYFTPDEWTVVENYKARVVDAARAALGTDEVAYVDALDAYRGSPEWFLDPAHLTHFDTLADRIVEHTVELGWLDDDA